MPPKDDWDLADERGEAPTRPVVAGRCDGCGDPIGDERLEALPWASECISCRGKRARR